MSKYLKRHQFFATRCGTGNIAFAKPSGFCELLSLRDCLMGFLKKGTASWILRVSVWLLTEFLFLCVAFVVYTILFSQYGVMPLQKYQILDFAAGTVILSIAVFAGIKLHIINNATRRWFCWPIFVVAIFFTTRLLAALYFASLFILLELFNLMRVPK